MSNPDEQALTGGNVSAGVVRIGGTVRKPAGPHTASVEAFLSYLDDAGFSGAPRTLGQDEQGRHVVEYVPGEIAHSLPPMDLEGLHRVGGLIRKLHDLSEGFRPPPGAHWDVALRPDRAELICHNDLAPWNLVVADDRWVFIDWDGAGPGSRMWDLAYSVTSFVPFQPDGDPASDGPRVRALADGYELTAAERRDLPPLIGAHARAMFELLRTSALTGRHPWAGLYAEGHGDYWGPVADYADNHIDMWLRALSLR